MFRKTIGLWAILCAVNNCDAQQTVGIFLNTPQTLKGYTLLAPLGDSSTYLLNNCGQIVHQWQSTSKPGLSCFLLEDGSLIRPVQVPNPVFSNQGGGQVERVDWQGNLLWKFKYSSTQVHQHHDIVPMPNGHVLLLAFEFKTAAQALAKGRKTTGAIWPEHIIEVNPVGPDSGQVVWEWHAWDHVIQDYDSSKQNFGVVAQHPELLDLNYRAPGLNASNSSDWLHGNAIDYNPELDQVILSSRVFCEFYIIDHSTTTAQAASHSGGKYGRGGDILYRWGNPHAYQHGDSTQRQLFFQHHVHWIKKGLPGEGHVLAFNNGTDRPGVIFSSVDEITTPMDSAGYYTSPGAGIFGPLSALWTYKPAPFDSFYSSVIGGADRLPNGHTLVCEGAVGRLYEIDSVGNRLWKYINPSTTTGIVGQGTVPINNSVFRSYKYPETYPAFNGKNLTPLGYVELNPGNYNCNLFDSTGTGTFNPGPGAGFSVYPNPCINTLHFLVNEQANYTAQVYNSMGELIWEGRMNNAGETELSVSDWKPGIYFIRVNNEDSAQPVHVRLLKL